VAAVGPTDGKGIVMADEGLGASWLVRAIQQKEWHPMLRVLVQGFDVYPKRRKSSLYMRAVHPLC